MSDMLKYIILGVIAYRACEDEAEFDEETHGEYGKYGAWTNLSRFFAANGIDPTEVLDDLDAADAQ